jgi:hypothetical protein
MCESLLFSTKFDFLPQKIANVKKAFSTVATLVRIHLISLLDVYQLLRNVKQTYERKKLKDLMPSLFPV